jgi:hypothetical protein
MIHNTRLCSIPTKYIEDFIVVNRRKLHYRYRNSSACSVFPVQSELSRLAQQTEKDVSRLTYRTVSYYS